MEQETILYFDLKNADQKNRHDSSCAAKRHWWQEPRLELLPAMETGNPGIRVLPCRIPPYYYRRRKWKSPVLSILMEHAVNTAEGMTDALISPSVEKLFAEEEQKRWQPRMDTLRRILQLLIRDRVRDGQWRTDLATVRLGAFADADWQMEMAWELLQPYLPRINRCVIFYVPIPGVDMRDELDTFLEAYSYEYGLVAELRQYGESRESTGGISLDFCKDNPYRQAWKYLDTMVKNKYD